MTAAGKLFMLGWIGLTEALLQNTVCPPRSTQPQNIVCKICLGVRLEKCL